MREVADRARIEAFMTALAREATADVNVFHVVGTTAVLLGWRDTLMDLDLAVVFSLDAPSFRRAVNDAFPV